MADERHQVLTMLAEGKIGVEEAERLLKTLEETKPEGGNGTAGSPRYLRVVVDDADDKVNVRVPFQLIRAGIKLSALIPEVARDDINKKLEEKGVRFDLDKLKPEHLDELVEALQDLTVDVGGKTKVRVFCE